MAKKSIQQVVAEEMNKVMMYGMDESGKLVEPSEQIDMDMSDEKLAAEIAKRAIEDLRPDDKVSFSKEAWQYFAEKKLLPEGASDGDEEDEPAPVDDAPAKKEDKPEKKASKRDEEKAPAKKEEKKPAAKKEEKKASKREDEDDAPKKKEPKEKSPSFEDIACRIVKKTPPEECYAALMSEFTELYKKRGKDNAEFIEKRVDIYYRIAAQRLGVEMHKTSKRAKAKKEEKKASKRAEA